MDLLVAVTAHCRPPGRLRVGPSGGRGRAYPLHQSSRTKRHHARTITIDDLTTGKREMADLTGSGRNAPTKPPGISELRPAAARSSGEPSGQPTSPPPRRLAQRQPNCEHLRR